MNYPKEKFNNNKYVYALGFLDNENTFKTEYLFIYRKGHTYFNNVKKNLVLFLLLILYNLHDQKTYHHKVDLVLLIYS